MELRALVTAFVTGRRDSKSEKLAPDDPKRSELQARFDFATWIDDAAGRVHQIQSVTHTLKPLHPDAKGTNLYCAVAELPNRSEVGSHCLGTNFAGDVVGNAAALDVHKFLKLTHKDRTLLDLMLAKDADIAAALSDDPAQAEQWIAAFTAIVEPRGKLASHTNAKQLYWLAGEDPMNDADYHLMAPLYASSLAHRVFQTINEDRFGKAAKEARQARREGLFAQQAVHEYPQLAVQKLGGTKPQNISQLNSERGGNNYLLASLPPVWTSADAKPLLNADSMFLAYGRLPAVREGVKVLLAFLKTDPDRTQETREYRDELVNALADELLQFAAELGSLPPGWSQLPECRLSAAEKHFLDPGGVLGTAREAGIAPPVDSADEVSESFSNWLSARLRDPLPMGDPEYLHWRDLARTQLDAHDWEGNHDDF